MQHLHIFFLFRLPGYGYWQICPWTKCSPEIIWSPSSPHLGVEWRAAPPQLTQTLWLQGKRTGELYEERKSKKLYILLRDLFFFWDHFEKIYFDKRRWLVIYMPVWISDLGPLGRQMMKNITTLLDLKFLSKIMVPLAYNTIPSVQALFSYSQYSLA